MVLNHHLRHGHGMTLIAVQDGGVVFRDGKVGTEQACCCEQPCVCPDMQSLCISVELTDYSGVVHAATQDDIIWTGNSGVVYLKDFEYVVQISCTVVDGIGGIDASAGWAGLLDDCICTSAGGDDTIPCSAAGDWYLGELSGVIDFDDIGVPCDGGCPSNVGSFSVTISEPPC